MLSAKFYYTTITHILDGNDIYSLCKIWKPFFNVAVRYNIIFNSFLECGIWKNVSEGSHRNVITLFDMKNTIKQANYLKAYDASLQFVWNNTSWKNILVAVGVIVEHGTLNTRAEKSLNWDKVLEELQ